MEQDTQGEFSHPMTIQNLKAFRNIMSGMSRYTQLVCSEMFNNRDLVTFLKDLQFDIHPLDPILMLKSDIFYLIFFFSHPTAL